MKSNVVLQSKDRVLLGTNIPVMSKDSYVCITDAVNALNRKREENGLSSRRLRDIMLTSSFSERCFELINKLNNMDLSRKASQCISDNKLKINSIRDLNKIGLAYRRGKGLDQKWFVNPYLFVMIALEMDPEIYAEVVIWLTDGLVENRNEAGDAYIRMCSSVSRLIQDKSELKDKIIRIARAINFIVFNRHEDGIRNMTGRNELNEIISIENIISSLIDDGFIKDYDSLINYLGVKWRNKWGNPIFSVE